MVNFPLRRKTVKRRALFSSEDGLNDFDLNLPRRLINHYRYLNTSMLALKRQQQQNLPELYLVTPLNPFHSQLSLVNLKPWLQCCNVTSRGQQLHFDVIGAQTGGRTAVYSSGYRNLSMFTNITSKKNINTYLHI